MLSQNPNKQELQKLIQEHIRQILEEKGVAEGKVPEIGDENRLGSELGLSSLDLAQLVATLEMRLKADPFQELVPITSVRTVADLIGAYEKFFSGDTSDGGQADALLESKRRAEARRNNRS
ncbi:acyl carrier protein [Pyxidicoccus parkwayensis]|uniref:Acyl carrier protein n=1 Tax=Pyxidicoccus parkwayensis TaxID=2813578 RepID=A0ABX7NTY9_9BACT|nr:acyl carrier protein [Pyxidicoccus parkwaysis]QSQ20839.1 acyl carrier protein [Pyxidicoccus parkwaysis]